MNNSLLLSISLLIILVPLKSGNAGEPFVANTPFELAGCVQIHDQTVAAKLVDRDQNGSFTDGVDRLFLDLDGDGQFHPLRERFAVADALRIRGTGTTEQYALTITSEPWQVTLDPIVGSGVIKPTLKTLSPKATLIEVAATIVSQTGIHTRIDALDVELSLPVGKYRLENVRLEIQDERRWSMAFEQFDDNAPLAIEVQSGETTDVDLIGALALSASVHRGGSAAGHLTVQPILKTSAGLTVIKSAVGKRHATQDNQLTASLVRLDKKTPDPKDATDSVDVKGTGFACGTFCPINLSAGGPLLPGMMVALQFDAGPLGGKMLKLETVKSTTSDLLDAAKDLLDLPSDF